MERGRSHLSVGRRHSTARVAAQWMGMLLVLPLLVPSPAMAAGPNLAVKDTPILEADAAGVVVRVPVVLSSAASSAVTVEYATVPRAARAPQDFTLDFGEITFPAGATRRTIPVAIAGDVLDEANEVFKVVIFDAVKATIVDTTALVTIKDDDPTPTIAVANHQLPEPAAGADATMTFPVTISAVSGRPLSVAYTFSRGAGMSGSDASIPAMTGRLTFPAGTTARQMSATIHGDVVDEIDEKLTLTFSNPVAVVIADGTAVGTVVDDDGPTITFADTLANEGTTAQLTVGLSAASVQAIPFTWSSADGNAAAPADYTAAGGSAVIPAGQTSATIDVTTVEDAVDEVDETLTVGLSAVDNAVVPDPQAVVSVDDDDGPSISIANLLKMENFGANLYNFQVTLSAPSPQQVEVDWSTVADSATAPDDFTAVTGQTLTFAPGDTTESATVTVSGDLVQEPNETMTVELTDPVDATIGDASGVGSILNDDCTDSDETIGNALNLGNLAGDADGASFSRQVQICANDHDWFKFTLIEDSSASKNLTARISLQLPAPMQTNGDLDLCVYKAGPTLVGCSTNSGLTTEIFDVVKADTMADDTTSVWVEVRDFGVNTGMLQIHGNVATTVPPNL